MAACGPVDFGGRTPATPCLGWLGCAYEDYNTVRRALLLEHNALVRSLNAFNKIVGDKTASPRWAMPGKGYKNQTTPPGIITWDGPTTAAWDLSSESEELLAEYPDGLWSYSVAGLHLSGEGPIAAMLKLAMAVHAATCDVNDALAAAGQQLPQQAEAPPPEQTIAQQFLDFGKELGAGLGVLAVGTIAVIFGYNYVTKKKGNRW